MDKEQVWSILEIEETKDEGIIKNAYRTKLVNTNPEDDPEGFKKLREAFELAISYINEDITNENKEENEVDIWIHEAENIYRSWSLRTDINEWKTLLSSDICQSLDTADEATEKFLVFLMSNYNLKWEIWKLIESTFEILNLKDEIREKFPVNFYEFVCNQIRYQSFILFDEFEGADDAEYDKAIDCYYALKRTIDTNNPTEIKLDELISELDSYDIYHPYFEVEKLRFELLQEHPDRSLIEDYVNRLSVYEDNFYVMAYVGEAYLFLEKFEEADKCISVSQELNHNFMGGDLCRIKYFMAVENYSEAKERSTTYLDKYGNNPEGIYYMKKANEMLMMDFRKKADEGDVESLLELGWCLFQNEQFDECISMLEKYTPDEEYEFDYNNLRGRCTLAAGRYKEALPFLEKWLTGIIELKDDGTEKYKKRIRRLGYANYTVSMSYASIGEELIKADNYEQGIEKYNTAIEYMKEAIETEKELREVMTYRERLAFLLTKVNKNEEAIDICDEIIKEESQYYPAYCTRQYAYYNLRHGQGVIDDFYNAIEIYNGNSEPYVLAIKAFIGYEQYDDAENIINMAKEAGVHSDDITLQELIIRRCKNIDDNESIYDSILEGLLELENKVFVRNEETDIDKPVEITYQIGLLYADRRMLLEALNIMDKCFKQSNDTKYLWVKAGINERFGKDAEALEVFKKMEKIITDDDELYYRIGRCLERLKKSDGEQLEYYMKAYSLNQNHRAVNDCISQIYNDRFNASGNPNDYKNAVMYADKQIEVNPGSYVLINRGLIFLDGGEIDKAIADFEEALRYDSEDMYAYNNIGYANKRIRNYDRAIEYYKKGLEVETDDSKRLLYRNLYLAYLISGKYEEAFEITEVFKENDKNKTDYVDMIAELFGRQNKFKESIDLKSPYENEQLDKVSFYISQAEDFLHLGNKKEAKANYTKAKKFLDSEGDKREYYDSIINYYIFAENNVKKAIDMAHKSVKAHGTVNTYTTLCRLYYRIGKKDKVKENYDKAMELIINKWGSVENYINFPRWRTLHLFIMGLLCYYTEKYEEAEKYFNEMENSPRCSMCHYDKCYERLLGKGLIEIYKGNKKEALEILREASSIAPTFFEAEEEIKELEK